MPPKIHALLIPLVLFCGTALAKEAIRSSVVNTNIQNTCSGTYPSYFQDPAFSTTGMWDTEVIINQPPSGWQGPVFKLSDHFATARPETNYPWMQFDPFAAGLSASEREAQAMAYILAVMAYIQEGNVGSGDVNKDWTLCDNPVRSWYHIPYQTYEPMSGREFVHGLTREAPVTTRVADGSTAKTTIWAVGFYNPAAGNSLGKVWNNPQGPAIPSSNFAFNNGSVIGKLLFTTATPTQYPFLNNVPAWQANISDPAFCACKPSSGNSCTFEEQTQQCPRKIDTVHLLQFDIAVRDTRSPVGWAYGTFVADGQRKAGTPNPWQRISPLGLMWGNDTPPVGTGAVAFPQDPRVNGFKDGVIFWDTVDMLNAHTDAGHLGCNSRLNGPADNAQSSCLSCHQTASVPDMANSSPAIMYQFGGFPGHNGQCMTTPDKQDLLIDQTYFDNFLCSTSFGGPASVVPPPQYSSGSSQWISTDFSLQLSISLTQWQAWQQHKAAQTRGVNKRVFQGVLPAR